MTPELKAFISTYADFTTAEIAHISEKFKSREVKKKEFLLREGEVCNDIIFVQSGCLRLYYIAEEVETSVWFSFSNSSAIDIYSFISEKPSVYFIQAIENSEVLVLPKPALNKLYHEVPKMEGMMRRFWEDVVINLLERFNSLQNLSADQRYLDLLKKPGYMQNIPQKYLASFIGITPTSLSRVKKKTARVK
jgi:CRP-like cAMP-binding protein